MYQVILGDKGSGISPLKAVIKEDLMRSLELENFAGKNREKGNLIHSNERVLGNQFERHCGGEKILSRRGILKRTDGEGELFNLIRR